MTSTMVPSESTKHNRFNGGNIGYGTNSNMFSNQYGFRGRLGRGYGIHHNHAADVASIAHSFQGMSLNQSFAAPPKNAMMPTSNGNYGGVTMAATMPSTMYGATGQYLYANNFGTNASNQSSSMYTPHASQYMPHLGYQTYQHHDNGHIGHLAQQNWTPTTATTAEVPILITPRRDSVSSNENDQPATPSYSGYPAFTNGGVAINRSPSGVFTHSSPSPTSMITPYAAAFCKRPDPSETSPRIKILVSREPAIPRAIPAPSSPLKALDRALENQRGETNVYIRGLLPETTDEMLEAWGRRFGDILSSKSIIDHTSGLCKGFGFVKYHNYEDAENCIRGFHYLGYEVSFARESFYSKLKTFADDHNTNLYVSNLPLSLNEHELANIFAPHKVCSSKILRDKHGHGRGVGFARFDSRDTCEEVIKAFNNHTVKTGDDELQIQIRFADTHEQKMLKQQTQAARQFRSAEYEHATQAWRQGRMGYAGSTVHDLSSNELEQHLATTAAPIHTQRWTQSSGRQLPGRSPLGSLPVTNNVPSTLADEAVSASGEHERANSTTDSVVDSKVSVGAPVSVHIASPVDSVTSPKHE